MADRNNPDYVPGRGLPPYLLSRTYDGSSTDSDGASRIFMDTDPSRTTGEYTGSSATSIITYSSSSFSMSSNSSIFNANSNSERNAFQHEPSSVVSSIYGESSDTRTIRSETQSNFGETYSIVSNREPVREVSIPSSISYMDTLYTGPICLTKSDNHDTNVSSDYSYNSNVSTNPANMFTPYVPYVSLFPESRTRSGQPWQEKNLSNGLFFYYERNDVVSWTILDQIYFDGREKSNNDILNDLGLTPPNFDTCCLWGDSRVDVCGSTSRRECY